MVAKKNLCVLILAGGKGTRMKSSLPKPLHNICGGPILSHILKTAQKLKPAAIGVLTGHQSEFLKQTVKDNLNNWGIKTPVEFLFQKELTGSGTAAKDSVPFIKKYDRVLILAGDAPLVKADTLKNLIKTHEAKKASCTVFTVTVDNPYGYGRIIKAEDGSFKKIVEQSEADAETAAVKEVNSGMYVFDTAPLIKMLALLRPQGVKKEYYLTDTLGFLKQNSYGVEVFNAEDFTEAMGINSKKQLAEAAKIMRAKINDNFMEEGVTFINPEVTYIDPEVKIGADSTVYPNCHIQGKTVIGENCVIGPDCWIENSKIEDGAVIKSGSYITDSSVGKNCQVGPYAHLRPMAVLKEGSKVGNYVEIKKAVIGKGSKVSHLTYIGDTDMGAKVNIGAGTITCNYDGVNKFKTVIGDEVFVGSNTNFVAPVKIGRGAKIGAGSTITEDVPSAVLAIARARQVNLNKKKGK